MKRSVLQFVIAGIVLMTVVTAPAPAQGAVTAGSVSGIVRNSSGVPQLGAIVELLRADSTVVSTVYTDSKGHFSFKIVLGGQYAVKAMGTAFLPTMVEHVRVRRSNAIVNLTLNTLYEAMQWLPISPQRHVVPGNNGQNNDDWSWTLRASANRPLLRWLEDGPLIVVSEGSGSAPRLKARVLAEGGSAGFAEGGEHIAADMERQTSAARSIILSTSVSGTSGNDAGMESLIGMEQQLGLGASFETGAAFAVHPELGSGASHGLTMISSRTSERLQVLWNLEAEAGSEQVMARLEDGNTLIAALPFAALHLETGKGEISYRLATARSMHSGAAEEDSPDERDASAWLPNISAKNGSLMLEHGLHQELAWAAGTDTTELQLMVFHDHLENPVVEAYGHLDSTGQSSDSMLYDTSSGYMRGAGPSYSGAGIAASVTRKLPGGNRLRLSYANSDTLVLDNMQMGGSHTQATESSLAQILASTHARRAQMYSIGLSGMIDSTGTRWRAGYRWQPASTVTAVAPFSADGGEPYLSIHIRQPLHLRYSGKNVEVLVDMRNLLAEGYRAFLTDDGSRLYFAQDQRRLQAGLAFNF